MAKFRRPFDPKVLDVPLIDDGGPASKMTVRDYFAGQALPIAIEMLDDGADVSTLAYQYADRMIHRRKVQP